MKKIILFIAVIALLTTNSFAQKEKIVKLFTINFVTSNTTIQKELSLKSTTKLGTFEDDNKTSVEYILQKVKLTEMKTIDSMYIEGYKILGFNILYKCKDTETKTTSNTNYFDDEKLKLIRSDCNGAHAWIEDFWVIESSTQKKKLISSVKLY